MKMDSLYNYDHRRIVLIDAPGQTCNRFWAYLDSIAWAVANNRKVVIFYWDTSIRYFDALRNNKHVSFPFYIEKIISIFGERKWKLILLRLFNNRISNRFYCTNLAHRIGFIHSWPLRKSHVYYPQIKEKLIPIFRPNEDICVPIEDTMQQYKSKGYFVIGVHIRRGDYRNWEGGKYYYEMSDYADTMRSLNLLYKDKKVAFFISTNEQYDESVFSGLTLCRFNNTTAAHDLYTLSLCDRIIGPLSTFSRWASWYGNVPLALIEKGQTNLKESDFSIIHDFYHFTNGNEIVNLSDKKS